MTKTMKIGTVIFVVILLTFAVLNGNYSSSPAEAFLRQMLTSVFIVPLYFLLYLHENKKVKYKNEVNIK